MPKNPTRRQVRKLLSKASPLTAAQKARLKREIHGHHLRTKTKSTRKRRRK